jgi:hypothetical protein
LWTKRFSFIYNEKDNAKSVTGLCLENFCSCGGEA